jgi:hypothetical protein
MGVQENVQIVKDGYAAYARGDIQGLLAMLAEDIEWISPGEGLPLAGTYRGHAAVADFFQKVSEMTEFSSFEPPRLRGGWRPGSGRRLRQRESQSHNRTFEKHWGHGLYCSEWKSEERPGVYRHASRRAGLFSG